MAEAIPKPVTFRVKLLTLAALPDGISSIEFEDPGHDAARSAAPFLFEATDISLALPGAATIVCSITGYCHDHGFWHGGEAEELRSGLEGLLAKHRDPGDPMDANDVLAELLRDMQKLVDDTDARDSLAYREMREESGLSDEDWPPGVDSDG